MDLLEDYLIAVKRGYTLLSTHFSFSIDTERLDMMSFYSCVLGQIFGDYFTGIEKVKPYFTEEPNNPVYYGFRVPARHSVPECTLEETKKHYHTLTLAWKEYLLLQAKEEE